MREKVTKISFKWACIYQTPIDRGCVIGLMELVEEFVPLISLLRVFCKLLLKTNFGDFKMPMANLQAL